MSDFLSATILWASPCMDFDCPSIRTASGFDSFPASSGFDSFSASSGFDSFSASSFVSSDALKSSPAIFSFSSWGDLGEVEGLGEGVDYH